MSLFQSELVDLAVEVLILLPGYGIARVIKRLRGDHTETSVWNAWAIGAAFWAAVACTLWFWI